MWNWCDHLKHVAPVPLLFITPLYEIPSSQKQESVASTICERSTPNFKHSFAFSCVSSGKNSHSSSSKIWPITGWRFAIAYSLLHSSVSSSLQSSLQMRRSFNWLRTWRKAFLSAFSRILFLLMCFIWYVFMLAGSTHKGKAEKQRLGTAYLLQLEDMSLKIRKDKYFVIWY